MHTSEQPQGLANGKSAQGQTTGCAPAGHPGLAHNQEPSRTEFIISFKHMNLPLRRLTGIVAAELIAPVPLMAVK